MCLFLGLKSSVSSGVWGSQASDAMKEAFTQMDGNNDGVVDLEVNARERH